MGTAAPESDAAEVEGAGHRARDVSPDKVGSVDLKNLGTVLGCPAGT